MSAFKEIAFVTGNPNKVREAQLVCSVYGIVLEQTPLPLREIQGEPKNVVNDKIEQAHQALKRPVVVNDSSWSIPALNGFPGAYMHDVNNWFKGKDLARLMSGVQDRRIILTDTIAYHDGEKVHMFDVQSQGTLSAEPRGSTGPASDQMAIFDRGGRTISECRDAGIVITGGTETMWQKFANFIGETSLNQQLD